LVEPVVPQIAKSGQPSLSKSAQAAALESLRIHGGVGYSKDRPVERFYRDAPLLLIGGGTNELQRLIIARRLVERFPVK